MKLALIGNCSFQALVDDQARVVWLCWPRFDSSPVFGALLDEERGGEFSIQPASPQFDSQQEYVPNTNIVRTRFTSAKGVFEVLDFAPRFLQYERHYRPNMLVRRVRRISGEPLVRVRCNPTYDYGRIRPDVVLASNHLEWKIPGHDLRLTTNVPLNYIIEERPFLLEHDCWIVTTWGPAFEAPLIETADAFYDSTRRYWERWVKHTALPGRFQKEVVRSALALKLHQYQDTGAITAASTTSLPEFPGSGRNWDYRFCWLRDAYFTLRALRRLGHFDEMEAFVNFLKNIASQHDRLQPVYGISGEAEIHERIMEHLRGHGGSGPVRSGNDAYRQVQYDAYGEMVAAIAPFLLDFRFEEHLTPNAVRLVKRLLKHISDFMHDPDAGIWEIRDDNRVHTFSMLFHWVGGMVSKRIGEHIADEELRRAAEDVTERAKAVLEEKCWLPEKGFYADSTGSQNPDAAMLMMINLGYLPKGHPHAESHLRALQQALQIKGHLMHRYLHHDGIGDTHATFTVCGFWLVESLARLGFTEEAEEAFEKMLKYSNHVGLFSEDIHPETGLQLGNFPQTYSHVGVINSAFAISPLPVEVGDP